MPPQAPPGAPPRPAELSQRLSEAAARRRDPARTRHLDAGGGAQFVNRLALESSPYLLQHAHNPVDWRPWGDEAFAEARARDVPVFLSVGYSTCHWCHVMERESYENPETAALMNKYLINIKVDREERPDVDKIYMTAVSAMTGQGGWPLNMFLTPDLKPIFGGTYFPPEGKWGQPAWPDVVKQIGETWRRPEDRKKMIEAADTIADSLKKYAEVSYDAAQGTPEWLDEGYRSLKASYDSARGGFGQAPKFPMPVYHNFLLRYYARNRTPHPNPLPKGEGGGTRVRRTLQGDIAINVHQAALQAKKMRHPLKREMRLLLIHGILHLLGYTDYAPVPRRRMFKRQNAILRNWEAKFL